MSPTVTRGQRFAVLLAALAAAFVFGPQLGSQGRPTRGGTVIVNGHEAVAGEVLVRFNRQLPAAERVQMEAQLDADESEPVASNTRRLRSRIFDTSTLVSYMRTRGDVAYAEPNYILHAINTPNDPSFGNLWGLLNLGQTINGTIGFPGADIDATLAWDVTTGSAASSVVAVVDTGIDYNHPDLAANAWSAPAPFSVTIGGLIVNCLAGTHGYNAINRTCNPQDDHYHGTHVSGTIGAVGNNGIGVAGVNWTTSIMGAKFLDASGSGTLANAINAIEFVIQAKQALMPIGGANVRVLSNSWGGGGFSQALFDEITKANANEMLFVAAAGNSGSNNGTFAFYPANYNTPNMISVAATDNRDQRASFSNYGPNVHLGAPGVNVYSTTPGNSYAFLNGTSMATPHVSGAAALILSQCPLSTASLKQVILNTVDPVLNGWVSTNGRLNVNNAIAACVADPVTYPAPVLPGAPTLTATAGNGQVALSWGAVSGASTYRVKRGTSSNAEVTVATVTSPSYTDTGRINGTTYYYTVSAVNAAGEGPDSVEQSATPFLRPATPTGLVATTGSLKGQINLVWNASVGATSYNVKRSTSSNGFYSTVATGLTSTSYTNSGLTSGRRYYYVVAALNAAGSSPNSSKANATAK